MSEQVKVFKNISNVTPTANNVGFDIPILTTTATQRVVIKDVITNGFALEGVTLDLDGFPMAQGQNLSVAGNMIMGPSSTLKLTVATPLPVNNGFVGLYFAGGSSGIQHLVGDGTVFTYNDNPGTAITPTKLSSTTTEAEDATAGKVGDTIYFYRLRVNTIYKYKEDSTTHIASMALSHVAYGMTNDGTYLYFSYSAGNQTKIQRHLMSDLSRVTTDLVTNQIYSAKPGNQGSYFLHHEGKIYARAYASDTFMDIIDLSTLNVTRINNGDFGVGSYSDGATIVTTLGGTTYIVEQGQTHWSYFNIATNTVVRVSGGSNSSTEYGESGAQVAPGMVLVFGEQQDDVSVIDINPLDSGGSPLRFHNDGSHGYTTDYGYGNTSAFAGYFDYETSDYTYGVYVSGILIED